MDYQAMTSVAEYFDAILASISAEYLTDPAGLDLRLVEPHAADPAVLDYHPLGRAQIRRVGSRPLALSEFALYQGDDEYFRYDSEGSRVYLKACSRAVRHLPLNRAFLDDLMTATPVDPALLDRFIAAGGFPSPEPDFEAISNQLLRRFGIAIRGLRDQERRLEAQIWQDRYAARYQRIMEQEQRNELDLSAFYPTAESTPGDRVSEAGAEIADQLEAERREHVAKANAETVATIYLNGLSRGEEMLPMEQRAVFRALTALTVLNRQAWLIRYMPQMEEVFGASDSPSLLTRVANRYPDVDQLDELKDDLLKRLYAEYPAQMDFTAVMEPTPSEATVELCPRHEKRRQELDEPLSVEDYYLAYRSNVDHCPDCKVTPGPMRCIAYLCTFHLNRKLSFSWLTDVGQDWLPDWAGLPQLRFMEANESRLNLPAQDTFSLEAYVALGADLTQPIRSLAPHEYTEELLARVLERRRTGENDDKVNGQGSNTEDE